jgi:hypothetical protein
VIRAVLLLAAGCAQDTGPHLSSAMPASAPHDTTITIAGERMCDGDCAHAGGEFVIGLGADLPAVQLVLVAFADTSAQVMIPAAAPTGHADIVLTVNGHSSNSLAFEVLP